MKDYYEQFRLDEEIEELAPLPVIRNFSNQEKSSLAKNRSRKSKRSPVETSPELAMQMDSSSSFKFSYQASRHEEWWLTQSLSSLYESNWIKDVLRLVKGGKEASVYLCMSNRSSHLRQHYLAAKVYRPRMLRNLRNDAIYREGRGDLDIEGHEIRDDRMERAIRKRTAYGQELRHTSWIGHEFKTLQALHAAGADVPVPHTSNENAILMSYIGGKTTPAPTLNTVDLDPDEAQDVFQRVVRNLGILLAQHRVHGDLSAYNILYWKGDITLIDFPQAIDPESNRNAYRVFARDVARTCEYFIRQGVPCKPARLAADLWTSSGYKLQPEIHPSLLDEDDSRDRALWEKQHNE